MHSQSIAAKGRCAREKCFTGGRRGYNGRGQACRVPLGSKLRLINACHSRALRRRIGFYKLRVDQGAAPLKNKIFHGLDDSEEEMIKIAESRDISVKTSKNKRMGRIHGLFGETLTSITEERVTQQAGESRPARRDVVQGRPASMILKFRHGRDEGFVAAAPDLYHRDRRTEREAPTRRSAADSTGTKNQRDGYF